MNKKEKRQFERKLREDILKYLVHSDIDLNNHKEINKALKEFSNEYYTEIKYKLSINNDDMINIEYMED